MASDIWLRTILIVRKETRCRHIGYSFRLTASGALAGTRNSSITSTKWPEWVQSMTDHVMMYDVTACGHYHDDEDHDDGEETFFFRSDPIPGYQSYSYMDNCHN